MALSPGFRLGPYELVSPLGRGGMGEVWRARQRKLEREVAIKVLPEELRTDKERLARFEREARLASSLNHPNIVTIHDIAEESGILYIAMELVAGTTLRDILTAGPLPVSRAVAIAIQIADGLAKAHAAGVVHRDLKPENLMVTPDGLAKILDFGIARSLSPAALLRDASTTDSSTMIDARTAGLAGTPRYMSPEQLAQAPLDARSDQFAFGIVLYEMLAGKPPFDGPSLASIITAISHEPPPPLAEHRRDLPRDLAKLVGRCLAKRPTERFESMGAVVGELRAIETRRAARGRLLIGRRAAVASLLALAGLGGIAAWVWFRGAEKRWAANVAPAEIAQLVEAGDLFDAYRTVRRAKASVADPKLDALLERFTLPISIVTDPPGASVSMKDYGAPDTPWELLGTTPLEIQIPYAIARIRIEKQGYETFEGAPFSASTIGMLVHGLVLEPRGTRPAGTVRIPGGPSRTELARLTAIEGPAIPQFWLDRLEVSNSEFKTFVDAGGYADASLWTDGVSGERFRDPTGRPGPATWALGTFPDRTGDHPAGGVSWYEAAAFCRSKGKRLPTVYHWSGAIGQDQLSDILRMSNFDRKGPAPVGRYQGLGAFGTYDMAGNVREWCWNATSDGKRYALGGDWNDPPYAFRHRHALDPMERPPSTGIRCAAWREPPPAPLFAPVDPAVATLPEPVSKDAFLAYAAIYDYDRSPLEAKIERVDESSPYWRKEVISFRTAYDDERMGAILFLPRNASPPFQTVVWYPGDDASIFRSSERLASPWLFDFLPRSGRALVYPLYDGWYERRGERTTAPNTRRDLLVRRAKDLRRTIDYLETRKDIDASRLAYYGFSAGAIWGPIGTALEPRLRTGILLGGGIPAAEMRPEIHPALFAPYSTTPTLMISGEHDFLLPYETSQKPLFDLLGSPPGAKRHARLSGGHIPSDTHAIMREVLDWLDAHLGRVRTR